MKLQKHVLETANHNEEIKWGVSGERSSRGGEQRVVQIFLDPEQKISGLRLWVKSFTIANQRICVVVQNLKIWTLCSATAG